MHHCLPKILRPGVIQEGLWNMLVSFKPFLRSNTLSWCFRKRLLQPTQSLWGYFSQKCDETNCLEETILSGIIQVGSEDMWIEVAELYIAVEPSLYIQDHKSELQFLKQVFMWSPSTMIYSAILCYLESCKCNGYWFYSWTTWVCRAWVFVSVNISSSSATPKFRWNETMVPHAGRCFVVLCDGCFNENMMCCKNFVIVDNLAPSGDMFLWTSEANQILSLTQ